MITASVPTIMGNIEGLEAFRSFGVPYCRDNVGVMHSCSDI